MTEPCCCLPQVNAFIASGVISPTLEEVASTLPFPLDRFQEKALAAFLQGEGLPCDFCIERPPGLPAVVSRLLEAGLKRQLLPPCEPLRFPPSAQPLACEGCTAVPGARHCILMLALPLLRHDSRRPLQPSVDPRWCALRRNCHSSPRRGLQANRW